MSDINQQTKEIQSDTAMSFKAHWKHANRASKIAFVLTVISGIIIAVCILLLAAMFLVGSLDLNHHQKAAIAVLAFFLMLGLGLVLFLSVIPIIVSLTQCFISSNKIPRISLLISLVSGIYPGIFIFASISMADEGGEGLGYRALSISAFFLLIAFLAFILFIYKNSRLYKNSS